MIRNQTTKVWRSAAQCLLGIIALALVTWVFFRLGIDLATTAFAYLIVIVPLSLMGSFLVSAFLSIMAVALLNYFFAAPIFNFQVELPQDVVLVTAFVLTSLTVTGLVGRARRQTETALQAETRARESEQRFRDYAETAADWLWETGPDHGITRVSQRGLDAIGTAPVYRIGLTRWSYATDVESEPEKWRRYRAMLAARQPFRDFVYSVARGDGSAMYVQTSGKPFFDAKGNFLGYRGVSTDVTAAVRAKQTEEALTEVQTELAHVTRLTT
jgi:PAS domain S-box-containing protein